jgi:hypothetical protein
MHAITVNTPLSGVGNLFRRDAVVEEEYDEETAIGVEQDTTKE